MHLAFDGTGSVLRFQRVVATTGVSARIPGDKISLPTNTTSTDYREWITSAYLVWTKGAPEFLTEYDHVNHTNILTNQNANSDAFYAQAAYRLPWFEWWDVREDSIGAGVALLLHQVWPWVIP